LEALVASSPDPRAAEKAQLLLRCRLTLDAIERAEPSPSWAELRAVVERSAGRVAELRSLVTELKALAAALPGEARQGLARDLVAHGIDTAAERERDAAAVAPVRARGRIRSEAEYRRVQAYADTLVQPEDGEEYLALGALLDEFMSRGAT
jgi:hypothetical protein